jgi:hypothetical protein
LPKIKKRGKACLRHTDEGDSVIGKRLYYEGKKVKHQSKFRKSGSHRGQRGNIYDGECWIEVSIDLPKKEDEEEE